MFRFEGLPTYRPPTEGKTQVETPGSPNPGVSRFPVPVDDRVVRVLA